MKHKRLLHDFNVDEAYASTSGPIDLTSPQQPNRDKVFKMAEKEQTVYFQEADDVDYDRNDKREDEPIDSSFDDDAESGNEHASMNFNSNGVVAQATLDLVKGRSFTEIKEINIGDVPLKPSGLTLSGSGMQLFVKLDPHIQKLLTNTGNVDIPHEAIQKTLKSRKATTKTKNGDGVQAFAKKLQGENGIDEMTRRMQEDNPEDGITNPPPTFKYPINYSLPKPTEDQVMPRRSMEREYAQRVINLDDGASRRRRPQMTMTPAMVHEMPPPPPPKRHCSTEPDWRRSSKLQKTVARPEGPKNLDARRCESLAEPVRANASQDNDSRRYFYSSDLPTSEPKRRYRSRDGCARENMTCVHPGKYPSHCRRSPSYTDSSNDGDEDYSANQRHINGHHQHYEDDRSNYHKDHRPDRRVSEQSNNHLHHHLREEDESNNHQYCLLQKQPSELSNKSSIGPFFDTTQITPQTMDSETLAKFTEYTQDMRKDLKKRYKDLSKLLRDFNQNVKEKNENSVICKTEKEETEGVQHLSRGCVVM